MKRLFSGVLLAALIVCGIMFSVFTSFEVQAAPNYTVSGYVLNPSGNVVPGAYTYLINSTGSSFGSGCFSNASGFYSMFAPAGTYKIVSGGESTLGLTYSGPVVVNSDTTKNITLVPSFKIEGYVLNSMGNGVSGASTNIGNSTWSIPATTTNSIGHYAVYAPAGNYTFIMWPPGNSDLMDYYNPAFVLNSDTTQNITLLTGFKVSGYVLYSSGEVVSGVSTTLTNSSGSAFGSGHWSDAYGHYYIVAPSGNYTLAAKGLSGIGSSYKESNIVLNSDLTKNITLMSVSINYVPAVLDAGQTQLFTALPSGGSGVYSLYKWYVNNQVASTQSSPIFSFMPPSAGSYSITLVVTDSEGATSSRSDNVSISANSALESPSLSASKTILDQSQASNITSTNVSTGTSPYSYQWYSKSPLSSSYLLIAGATSRNYYFATDSSTTTGTWAFVLNVNDSASTPVTVQSEAVSITVNPPPTVTLSPQNLTLDAGSFKVYTATASGGSSPLHYEWFLDGVPVGDDSASYLYSASLGSHTLYIDVTDSAVPPLSANSNVVSIKVNPALAAPEISATKSIIDQGQTSTLISTVVSTGTNPYSYQWLSRAPDSGFYTTIVGATLPTYSFVTSTSTISGTWDFRLAVTDSASIPVTVLSFTKSITVNTAPTVSVTPNALSFNTGQSRLLAATPDGGSRVYTNYQWYVNGTIQAEQTSTLNFTAISTGTYYVTAKVTDSFDVTSLASSAVTVVINPSLGPPTLTATPNSLYQGSSSTLTISVTTGTQPYTYRWYSASPGENSYNNINAASTANYNFVTSPSSAIGTWLFKVQITDGTGDAVNSTVTSIAVNTAPTPTPSPSPVPTATPTSHPSPTSTPTPTLTSTPTPTVNPTVMPSETTSNTPTPSPPPILEGPNTGLYIASIVGAVLIVAAVTSVLVLRSRKRA